MAELYDSFRSMVKLEVLPIIAHHHHCITTPKLFDVSIIISERGVFNIVRVQVVLDF